MRMEDFDPIMVVIFMVVAAIIGMSIHSGITYDNNRCQWEKDHGVVSYKCRDWKRDCE